MKEAHKIYEIIRLLRKDISIFKILISRLTGCIRIAHEAPEWSVACGEGVAGGSGRQ